MLRPRPFTELASIVIPRVLKVSETSLPGVLLIEPTVIGDSRGYFMEIWNSAAFRAAGIDQTFVQDNQSRSARGVLRGLHYQEPNAQGKLVRCTRGELRYPPRRRSGTARSEPPLEEEEEARGRTYRRCVL